jgi:inner membrane protein
VDNVTHSLFGYALGRAIPFAGADGADGQRVRSALVWSGVVASNLPDLDILVQPFAHDGRLTYLVQHRGYTHTWAAALTLGLIAGAACARLASVAHAPARRTVALFAAGACLLHIACDGLNDYGVHPFSPFYDRWFYGDCMSITEPLWLAVMLPLLAASGLSRTGRAIGVALSLVLLGLMWFGSFVSRAPAALASALLAFGYVLAARRRAHVRPTLIAIACVIAVFVCGSIAAHARIAGALARAAPEQRVIDVSSTPAPGNPLCWSMLALTLDRDAIYRVHVAGVSLLPALFDPARSTPAHAATTAPLIESPLAGADEPGVHFAKLFAAPAAELGALRDRFCRAQALLRFTRVPYWTQLRGAEVLGDMRYDRQAGLDFADVVIDGDCRDALPRWTPPRADLLSAPLHNR